jgi:hypothetical protein
VKDYNIATLDKFSEKIYFFKNKALKNAKTFKKIKNCMEEIRGKQLASLILALRIN